jgi:hypothetical protein
MGLMGQHAGVAFLGAGLDGINIVDLGQRCGCSWEERESAEGMRWWGGYRDNT